MKHTCLKNIFIPVSVFQKQVVPIFIKLADENCIPL